MTVSELIAVLVRVGAVHGDVRVVVVGGEDEGDGDGVLGTFGVHTAPWAREPGEVVTCCIDLTSAPELVTEADLA